MSVDCQNYFERSVCFSQEELSKSQPQKQPQRGSNQPQQIWQTGRQVDLLKHPPFRHSVLRLLQPGRNWGCKSDFEALQLGAVGFGKPTWGEGFLWALLSRHRRPQGDPGSGPFPKASIRRKRGGYRGVLRRGPLWGSATGN